MALLECEPTQWLPIPARLTVGLRPKGCADQQEEGGKQNSPFHILEPSRRHFDFQHTATKQTRTTGLVLEACFQSGEPLLEFFFGEPVVIHHDPGPFCHILNVFKWIRLNKEQVRTVTGRDRAELLFLM
jgi:hypothetical protein